MIGRQFCFTLAALCSLLLVRPANADNAAAARQLYTRGRQLMTRGEVDEACGVFKASLQALPKNGTRLHLARCHERQGKLATAFREYGEVAAIAHRRKNRARKKEAVRRRKALRPRLSKLIVQLSSYRNANITVLLDGEPLLLSDYGVPIILDPGAHKVEASGSDLPEWWSRTVVLGPEGDRKRVTIPVPELPVKQEPEESHSYALPAALFTISSASGIGSMALLGLFVQDIEQEHQHTPPAHMRIGFSSGLGILGIIALGIGIDAAIPGEDGEPDDDNNGGPSARHLTPRLSFAASPQTIMLGGEISF